MPSIQDSSEANTSRARRDGLLAFRGAPGAAPWPRRIDRKPAFSPAPSASNAAAAVTGTAAVAIGCLSAPAKTVTPPSCSMRTAISAPTRLRLSARMWPLKQAQAGDADLGFGRARDDRAVGVAHHDVADAHGGPRCRALDLGAADLDVTVAAEIFLDGGRKPRRHDVELNGPGGEPPQQRANGKHDETAERSQADGRALDPAAMAAKETGQYEERRGDRDLRRPGSFASGARAGRRSGTIDRHRGGTARCLCWFVMPLGRPLVRRDFGSSVISSGKSYRCRAGSV